MITYTKFENIYQRRIEFLINNFDYSDGNDYIAKCFDKIFGFHIESYFDGIWYRITEIRNGGCTYVLLWHEDVGNSIYCVEQKEENISLLEERLRKVLEILNEDLFSKN